MLHTYLLVLRAREETKNVCVVFTTYVYLTPKKKNSWIVLLNTMEIKTSNKDISKQ